MKRILIVDDNENNRLLLRSALETYRPEEGSVEFDIDEVENGVEAVAICAEKKYDLIFMDVMMPEMDGIEATKRIRAKDPRVLIVAVSAVEDALPQKEILQNGAEDYVSKPINLDIFNARLTNYLTLIASRRQEGGVRDAHNLFSREIYARKLFFGIAGRDDLAEFWEYYLLNTQMACAMLSDTVRTFYALGTIALQCGIKPSIWVEESSGYLYFTMEGLDGLDPKFSRLVLAKSPALTDYRSDAERLSIRFRFEECLGHSPAFAQAAPATPVHTSPEAIVIPKTDESENAVYDYMDAEDLDEIRNHLSRLNSLLLVVGSGDIRSDEVEEIALNLERVGKIASIYSQSYSIGQALNLLAEEIRGHVSAFIEKSGSLGALCGAFSHDLLSWIRLIFEEGAPSVSYMDDTIISNAQMIGNMLTMDDAAEEAVDLGDIFDF